MECEDIRRRLDEYIDRECAEDIAQALASHLETCPDCAREYAERLAFKQTLEKLPTEELPFDFFAELNERLEQEQRSRPHKKPIYKRTWARVLEACACLLLVVCLGGLISRVFWGSYGASAPSAPSGTADAAYMQMAMDEGSDSYVRSAGDYEDSLDADGDYSYYAEEAAEEPAEAEEIHTLSDGVDTASETQRKIIRDWNMVLRVDDFDTAMADIEDLAAAYGGYVVSSSATEAADNSFRSGDISIRVDADRSEEAVEEIGALGELESSYSDSKDITTDYYDLSARLEAYRAQEARLLELYDRANTVEEVLSVEDQLAATQAEIESLQGMLNYYDQVTALSLINISLYTRGSYSQTVEPQGFAGFWEKLSSGFLNGLNNALDAVANVFIGLVSILPVLVILGLVIWLAVFLIRRHKRKKKA